MSAGRLEVPPFRSGIPPIRFPVGFMHCDTAAGTQSPENRQITVRKSSDSPDRT
ncbi:MAG: hypothetical protein IKI45_15185 [Oscillospiraceae bacterium]|nr:hypothetical protein [Oscillospiraceae bacterium]